MSGKKHAKVHWDGIEGPEEATRGGVNESQSKFLNRM
jgi:hypothetical protein